MSFKSSKFLFFYPSLTVFMWGIFFSCAKKNVNPNSSEAIQEALISKGKASYMSNCTACHNTNPKLDGTLGPAIWHSSKELVTARILYGSYPAGYTPKRKTDIMAQDPPSHAAADIDAIHAFLNQE